MKIVKLGESKKEKRENNDPRLPAIELVDPIDDRADKKLYCGLSNEQRVGRENP